MTDDGGRRVDNPSSTVHDGHMTTTTEATMTDMITALDIEIGQTVLGDVVTDFWFRATPDETMVIEFATEPPVQVTPLTMLEITR